MFSKLIDALRSKSSSPTTTPTTSQPTSRNTSQAPSRSTSRPASPNASRPASRNGGGGSPSAAAATPFSVPRHESRNNFPGTNAASYGANNFLGTNPKGSRNPFPGDN